MSKIRPLLLVAATLFCAASTLAQGPGGTLTARPDRGMTPGAAYSVSDLDSVSLTSGSLNVSIPLASLPPIAGGKLGATITATYNSKLWDVERSEERAEGTIGRRLYVVDVPRLSDRGGWRIGGPGYTIIFRDAHADFNYNQPQQMAEVGEADWQWIQRQWWRAYLVTSDGAEHELVPTDSTSTYGGIERTYLIGSYSDTPQSTHAPMRYRTVDGTYLTALVNPDGTWVVTSPDGTQATRYADNSQRIKDTNNNSILKYEDADGTHYKDEGSGREIRFDGNWVDGFHVWYQTVGGVLQQVDVNVRKTRVRGKIYRVNAWNAAVQTESGQQGDMCVHDQELDMQLDVVREIVYPATESGEAGRRFTFEYNSDTTESFTTNYRDVCGVAPAPQSFTSSLGFGELSRIQTPTGAVVDYTYGMTGKHRLQFNVDEITQDMVTSKKLTHDGGVVDTWTYDISSLGTGGSVLNPDGTSSAETAYVALPGYAVQSGTANGMGGRVFRSMSGNVLVERRWRANPGGVLLAAPSGLVAMNPVVEAEYMSLIEGGVAVKMSAKLYQCDLNGNLTQTKEYDWFDPSQVSRDGAGVPSGIPSSATLLRQTDTSYYNTAPDSSSVNLYSRRTTSGATLVINAPQQTTLGASQTQFSYDGQDYGSVPIKGNLTKVSSFDDQGDTNPGNDRSLNTIIAYDSYGNKSSVTDPNGHVTTFEYDNPANGLVNHVTADPQNGTGVQTSSIEYDLSTGLVTKQTDPNGNFTEINYTNQLTGQPDPFGRAGITYSPAVTVNGVSQRQKAVITYEDHLRRVTVAADLNAEGDGLLKSRTTADELGRTKLVEQSEDGSTYTISARTEYEQGGRFIYQSNPRRSTAESTDGWTRATKDVMGRVIEVATFAGTAQPNAGTTCTAANGCTGVVSSAYYANQTTVVDQAGKVRRSVVDGLGRLVRVDEPDASNNLGSVDVPNQATSYQYDVLGNLTEVLQGSQTRSFSYSSVSRLKSAQNPESGTIQYEYDGAGNLSTRTDGRGIVTSYGYDGLGRVTSRTYSDSTPAVTYAYDTLANGKGRLTSVSSTVSVTSYTGYDALGRVTGSTQVTDGHTYQMPEYKYSLTGSLTSETYPSGRIVSTGYDNAGRLSSISGQKSGENNKTYADSYAYGASGAVKAFRLGNQLWERASYNSRMQPVEIKVGTSSDDTNAASADRLKLNYAYGTTDNNGNVQSQVISVPTIGSATGFTATQSYTYDALNRLKTFTETGGLSQTYDYDRYGNRAVTEGYVQSGTLTPTVTALSSYNAANNRIVGASYDGAGNVTSAVAGHQFSYDAENRMTSHDDAQTVGVVDDRYSYDGDGRRVKKVTGSVTTLFVYDAMERMVAEYTDYSTSQTSGVSYFTADHLGTPRIITNQQGSVISRHDYLPFGEEVGAGVGGRTQQQGYSSNDNLRFRFGTYERDNETGLDYALARYYANTQGRFTSVDPLMASAKPIQPQSWNRYAYCLNNPLVYVDPSGLIWGRVNSEGNPIWYKNEEEMKKAGATAFTPENNIYQATNGQWVRLNPNGPGSSPDSNNWTIYNAYENPYYVRGWNYTGDPNAPKAPPGPEPGLETDWNAQFAIGGILQGGAGLIGSGIKSVFGGATQTGGTTLYRAVTSAELEDILATGAYRTGGASIEGKYFFESAGDAAGFAKNMFRIRPQEGPFTITSTTASDSVIGASSRIPIAGEGTSVIVPKSQLPLGPVKVWNWSPKP